LVTLCTTSTLTRPDPPELSALIPNKPSAIDTPSNWAATATEWFPSNPWRLRPGPEIVAVLERADDFSTATCELWLPIEPT